jgi:serine-type D-Ala-D-Ala carboxypeptidase (penicillin-binding protein 5/6)
VRERRTLLPALVLAWGLVLLAGATPPAAAAPASPPRIAAPAWVLVDAADGKRLAGLHASRSRAMASTTKLMTAYLALRDLSLGRTVTAPPYHPIPGESLMGLRAGERVSVRDLLYGLLLPSGNDAAATLAVGDAGSIPAFVRRMNVTAHRLGLDDTSYANPIGLDDPGEYSSPRDLASLALRLRRNPLFRRIVDTPSKTLAGAHPATVVNRNDLLARIPWINGVKTGYTPNAGNVLVGSGARKGVTLVSVVMGAPTEEARDAETLALLRYGFALYRRATPVRRGQRLGVAQVPNGDRPLPLLAARAVGATIRRGQTLHVRVDAPTSVPAPIRRGQRIGRATVMAAGESVGSVPLLAARAAHVSASKSLVAQVDDAIPGPRGVVWALVSVVAAAIVIGIAVVAGRRRQ